MLHCGLIMYKGLDLLESRRSFYHMLLIFLVESLGNRAPNIYSKEVEQIDGWMVGWTYQLDDQSGWLFPTLVQRHQGVYLVYVKGYYEHLKKSS